MKKYFLQSASGAKLMKYGNLPRDLGYHFLKTEEMMFWLYCPVKLPHGRLVIPPNLQQFSPLIQTIREDIPNKWHESFLYLTAKTLFVSGEYIGNRPGWHSDGFGTRDLNYIWCDRCPTEFIESSFELPDDCEDSMLIMSEEASLKPKITYPDCHLLRLDPTVIHRSPVEFESGMRTFVKISVSRDRYNLRGNSLNHELPIDWDLKNRDETRNHPSK
jgi:hypothetical protein